MFRSGLHHGSLGRTNGSLGLHHACPLRISFTVHTTHPIHIMGTEFGRKFDA